MKTVRDIFVFSVDYLEKKGISNAKRSVEDLLGLALKTNRLNVYCDFDRPLNETELSAFKTCLKERATHKPLAYIEGKVQFLDCTLLVTEDVLIPRHETEELTSMIIENAPPSGTVFDLCTGCGNIAIAIKKHCPQLEVFASDISPKALEIAKKNALLNGVDVTFLQGDLLECFKNKQCDLFVCNPPYIATHHLLEKDVMDFEPHLALFAGKDGMDIFRRLAVDLHHYVRLNGKVFFEIGIDQKAIKSLFSSPFWKSLEIKKDFSQKERFFFLERESLQV